MGDQPRERLRPDWTNRIDSLDTARHSTRLSVVDDPWITDDVRGFCRVGVVHYFQRIVGVQHVGVFVADLRLGGVFYARRELVVRVADKRDVFDRKVGGSIEHDMDIRSPVADLELQISMLLVPTRELVEVHLSVRTIGREIPRH